MDEVSKKIDLDDFKFLIQGLNSNEKDLAEKAKLLKIIDQWEEIVGPVYYQHTFPGKVFAKTLQIVVDHPAYKMEIQFMKNIILKNINSFFYGEPFEAISIFIGKVDFKKNKFSQIKKTLEGKSELTEVIILEEDEIFKKKILDLISVF